MRQVEGPLKGAVAALKALQGSEAEMRELLGGMEVKNISLTKGHGFALQAKQLFSTYLTPSIAPPLQDQATAWLVKRFGKSRW